MRTAAIGTGSAADQVNGVAILLRQCEDLAAVEYRWPRLVRALEAIADRAAAVRRRGGEPAGLDGSLAWLTEVVHDHPALRGLDGAPMRQELLLLIDRIAGR
jgi:hypothetical protein